MPDIAKLKNLFKEGKNISSYLRGLNNINLSTAEIALLSYDLQAGSYYEFAIKNHEFFKDYAVAMALLHK